MPLEKMICGENYSVNLIKNNINELIVRGYEGVKNRFNEALKSDGSYTYIVTGDSTRDSSLTPSIPYYQAQLAKIGFDVVNNAKSGQSASDWLNNTSSANLQDAIDSTPGTGSTTILEMSLGINKESGQGLPEIKADIKTGLELYLAAKPDALIVFASPVKSNSSLDYDSIYTELANEFEGSVFVSCYDAMDAVYGANGSNDFYADNTHPNEFGAIRFVNYIFSSILPLSSASLMTIENSQSSNTSIPDLPAIVESGFYRIPAGTPEANADWRRIAQFDVEPNFVVKVDHGGNKFECIFWEEDGSTLVDIKNSTEVAGESYRLVTVPANAYKMGCQVSDEGAVYDALGYVATVEYQVEVGDYKTQQEINVGLPIILPIVNTAMIDALGSTGLLGQVITSQGDGTWLWV